MRSAECGVRNAECEVGSGILDLREEDWDYG
jgi:hypothetical protein